MFFNLTPSSSYRIFVIVNDFTITDSIVSNALDATGTWCSGITSASHAEGPGFKSQCVHVRSRDQMIKVHSVRYGVASVFSINIHTNIIGEDFVI